jgi:hypothetical protein
MNLLEFLKKHDGVIQGLMLFGTLALIYFMASPETSKLQCVAIFGVLWGQLIIHSFLTTRQRLSLGWCLFFLATTVLLGIGSLLLFESVFAGTFPKWSGLIAFVAYPILNASIAFLRMPVTAFQEHHSREDKYGMLIYLIYTLIVLAVMPEMVGDELTIDFLSMFLFASAIVIWSFNSNPYDKIGMHACRLFLAALMFVALPLFVNQDAYFVAEKFYGYVVGVFPSIIVFMREWKHLRDDKRTVHAMMPIIIALVCLESFARLGVPYDVVNEASMAFFIGWGILVYVWKLFDPQAIMGALIPRFLISIVGYLVFLNAFPDLAVVHRLLLTSFYVMTMTSDGVELVFRVRDYEPRRRQSYRRCKTNP